MSPRQLIHEAVDLSRLLLTLADREAVNGEEMDCLALDAVLRDCAYKIRRAAEDLQSKAERN
jgi:hypothetical protein